MLGSSRPPQEVSVTLRTHARLFRGRISADESLAGRRPWNQEHFMKLIPHRKEKIRSVGLPCLVLRFHRAQVAILESGDEETGTGWINILQSMIILLCDE